MRPQLAELSEAELRHQIEIAGPVNGPLDPSLWSVLHVHYDLLRRWLPAVALIGRGTVQQAPKSHYWDSLLAIGHMPADGSVLDFGSGAGFPGLVLAAARGDLHFVLVEGRERKAAFLRQTAAAMNLNNVEVHGQRWEDVHPNLAKSFSALTARAVDLRRYGAELESVLIERATWLAWGPGAEPPSDTWTRMGAHPGERESPRLTVWRRSDSFSELERRESA